MAWLPVAPGIPSQNKVHVLPVERQGSILWRRRGSFDVGKARALGGSDCSPSRLVNGFETVRGY